MTIEYTDAFPYRDEILPAPVNVAESGGTVTVLTFSENLVAGVYDIASGFTYGATSANDKLVWQVTGDITTELYQKEIKDPNDVLPEVMGLPGYIHAGGVLTLNLDVSISGVGNADINILSAAFSAQRVA